MMNAKQLSQFHAMCREALRHSVNLDTFAYLKGGLLMNEAHLIEAQIPYILNNMKYWRGETARRTKQAFRTLQHHMKG